MVQIDFAEGCAEEVSIFHVFRQMAEPLEIPNNGLRRILAGRL
jgi:hypothetical protein